MIEAAEGHFTTEALQWNQNKEERLASGITVTDVSALAILTLSSHLTRSLSVDGRRRRGRWRVGSSERSTASWPSRARRRRGSWRPPWPTTLCGPSPWVATTPPHLPTSSPALNASAAKLEAKGQSLDDYNYDNKPVLEIIKDQMENVKFNGISVSACTL